MEIVFHSARADAATRRKRNAALSFRTVLVEQSLEARIFADEIPNRIQLQTRDRDRTGSLQQMIQKRHGVAGVPEDRVNLRCRQDYFRPFESILALRTKCLGALNLSDGCILFAEPG